jgi:WD40 repeat protein
VRLRHAEGSHISCVAFSPDSRLIASAGLSRVYLWDTGSGKERRVLVSPRSGNLRALSFSPDGTLLAAGVRDGDSNNLFVWSVATGKLQRTFGGHRGGPAATAFLDRGKTLLSVGAKGEVCWWDVASGERRRRWDPVAAWREDSSSGRCYNVAAATIAPDGKALAALVGWDRGESVIRFSVIVWDLAKRTERWRLEEKNAWASPPAFSPDGKRLALLWHPLGPIVTPASWRPRTPAINDALTGKLWKRIPVPERKKEPAEGNLNEVCDIAFAAGGKKAVLATRGFGVRLWDLQAGKRLGKFCPPLASTQRGALARMLVALSPDGKRVLATWHRKLWLWDAASGREVPAGAGHSYPVDYLAFSADGRRLVSSSRANQWRYGGEGFRWDARTWKQRARLEGEADWSYKPVPCSPDFRLRVQRQEDGTLSVCDRASGKRLCKLDLRYREEPPPRGLFSPSNRLLLMPQPGQGRHCLLDATTGKRLGELPETADEVCFAFSPDDKAVAWFDAGGVIHVADVAGKVKWRLRKSPRPRNLRNTNPALTFSPDGRYLASWEKEDDISIWDLQAGKEHRRLAGKAPPEPDCSLGLAFSPDGHTLAVGGTTGSNDVQLWEVDSASPCRQLRGHRQPVKALAFSPDGRTLASGGEDATVLIWDLVGSAPGELPPLWAALAGEDARKAHRGLWGLVAAPRRAVAFLRPRLRAAAPPTPRQARQITRWLADLNSDEFAQRRQAAEGLRKLGRLAEPALRKALADRPSVEVRRQVRRLLEGLAKAPVSPQERQALRAVQALEHIGTPDARRLLRALAGGRAEARLTREAQAALRRLARRR